MLEPIECAQECVVFLRTRRGAIRDLYRFVRDIHGGVYMYMLLLCSTPEGAQRVVEKPELP